MILIKEIIRTKLSDMEDLKERSQLKKILKEVFMPLVEYQKEMHMQLEERVFNEVEDEVEEYNIYSTLVPRNKLALLDGLLFPILAKDQTKKVDGEELCEKIINGERAVVAKIFLKKSQVEIAKLKDEGRVFKGQIVTAERDYNINLKLEYNTDYLAQEKGLYNIFLENRIKWRTINNPYIRKFFNLVISSYSEEIEDLSEIQEINFDLEELEGAKYSDYIPVWNIKRVYEDGEGFPIPAQDKVHYDHEIILENLGFEHGYLVVPREDNELVAVKKCRDETGDKLVITSDSDQTVEWEIMQVVQKAQPWNEDFEFELLTNEKKDEFMNKMLQKNYKNIRTFAELNRLANSYKVSNKLKLEEIEILDKLSGDSYSYDFNCFIEDEIRLNSQQEIMVLKFSGANSLGYLKYDILSFIVSEIQLSFPEYLCKGVFK